MADAQRKISIRLSIEDAERLSIQFAKMGKDGEAALEKIKTAGGKVSPGLIAINAAANDLRGSMEGLAGRLGPVGSALVALGPKAIGVGAAIAGLVLIQKQAIESFAEMEKVQLRLAATLRATGNNTGLGRSEILQNAQQLSNTTAIDDKDILAASATLATFKSVSGEVFRGVLQQAANLSATFGGDLASNVEKLGGVMEQLAGGEAANLRKAFKFLSDAQVENIKTMAEANNGYEAQKELLKALQGTIGGSAAGAAGGLDGSLKHLGNTWDELMRSIAASDAIKTTIALLDGLLGRVNAILNFNFSGRMKGGTPDEIAASIKQLQAQRATAPTSPLGVQNIMRDTLPLGIGNLIPQQRTVGQIDTEIAALTRRKEALEADAKASRDNAAQQQRDSELQFNITRELEKQEEARKKAIAAGQALASKQKEGNEALANYLQKLRDQHELDGLTERDQATQRAAVEALTIARQHSIQVSSQYIQKIKEQAGANFDQVQEIQNIKSLSSDVSSTLTSGFINGIKSGKDFIGVLGGIADELETIALKALFQKPAQAFFEGLFDTGVGGSGGIFSALFGGARAEGGPVDAGKLYMVGERGPEFFAPKMSGSIIPNGALRSAGSSSGSGGVQVIVNYSAGPGANPQSTAENGNMLGRIVQAAVRQALQTERRPGGELYGAS